VAERETNVAEPPVGRPAIPDILEEHLEELAHLSIQRRKLLFSGEVPLRRVRQHAERIEAHLDGLRVGGAASVKLCEKFLEADDPWLVHAAGRVWLELGEPSASGVNKRLEVVAADSVCAWKETFRQIPREVVQRILPTGSIETLPDPMLSIVVDAWGWHGLLTSEIVSKLVSVPGVEVRFALARHADWPAVVARLLEDENVSVRRAALWRVALQRPHDALSRCRTAAREGEVDQFAVRVLGLFGDHSDGQLLASLASQKRIVNAVVEALRELAIPEFAEVLLDLLDDEAAEIVAVANVAFESLTGKITLPHATQDSAMNDSLARRHWGEIRAKLDSRERRLRGVRFPWQGDTADEPMEFLWRRSLGGEIAVAPALRREVPDGFFSGEPTFVAIPGE
jgi:hypothetical protein